MDLSDAHAGLTLTIAGYEFPAGGDPWDRNWLNINGAVRYGDRRWTFASACLQTNEAQDIAEWLDDAASEAVTILGDADLAQAWESSNLERDDHLGVLRFLEPDLAFTVRETGDDFVVLRLHLAHAAADPAPPDDDRVTEPPPWIQIRMPRQDLARAARVWRQELAPWPTR